jgi:hypothetical protein
MNKSRRATARSALLLVGIVLLAGGAILPLAIDDYWLSSKVEVYEGYEIEYFGMPGVYGVYKTRNAPPSSTTFNANEWNFYTSLDAAHRGVDDIVTPPSENFITEYTYKDSIWKIYSTSEMGTTLYFAKDSTGIAVPGKHTTIESLEAYLRTLKPIEPPTVVTKLTYFSTNRILLLVAGLVCLGGYWKLK